MSAPREQVRWWLLAVVGVVAWGVLGVSFAFTSQEIAAGEIQQALGMEQEACPGCALCGLSRAFSAASHGSWQVAMDLSRLFFPAYGVTWLMAIGGLVAWARLVCVGGERETEQ
jgi:hypothetical protein